jgi:hypothetical protein
MEEKIRRYFTNQELNDTNLDRLIPLLSLIIQEEEDDPFLKESINKIIRFAEYHKVGDLLQIYTIFQKLLTIIDHTVNPHVNEEEFYFTLQEYLGAKDCSIQVFENTYKNITSKLKDYWLRSWNDHIPIKNHWKDIVETIENIILEYRIRRFLDAIEDNFENTDDTKLFITVIKDNCFL